MDDDFRKRVGTPALLFLGLLVAIGVIAFSISRVLMAVPEMVATMLALLIAAYVLFVAAMVGKNTRISSQALGAGLVIGLVAVIGAGVVAAQAGMRELHHDDEVAENGETPDAPTAGIPDDAHVWVAIDIDYAESPSSIPAGEVTIAIDNQGNLPHDVAFEGTDILVFADGGQQAAQTYTVEPGSYTYYCTVPGHRAAGMEGTVEVN